MQHSIKSKVAFRVKSILEICARLRVRDREFTQALISYKKNILVLWVFFLAHAHRKKKEKGSPSRSTRAHTKEYKTKRQTVIL